MVHRAGVNLRPRSAAIELESRLNVLRYFLIPAGKIKR